MSASWTDTLRRWRSERLPHRLFVPAAFTLALASAVGQPSPLDLAQRWLWAWAALALLRLWDDLQDRHEDARRHPTRVRLDPVARPLAGLLLLGLTPLVLWRPNLVALLLALVLFYRLRRGAMEALLLTKYPALVVIARGSVDVAALVAALLVYAGMLIDGDLALPSVKRRLGRPGVLLAVVLGLGALHLLVTA